MAEYVDAWGADVMRREVAHREPDSCRVEIPALCLRRKGEGDVL